MERGLGRRALVLVVLAVAMALVAVAVSSGPAKAAEVEFGNIGADGVEPGDTVVLTGVAGDVVSFAINEISTASGSFASGGGQTLSCSTEGSCDADDDVDNSVQVKVNVADDSADGFIVVTSKILIATDGTFSNQDGTSFVINVKRQPKPASLTAEVSSSAIAATGGSATITATVKDDQATPAGMDGETVTAIASNGLVSCDSDGDGTADTTAALVCQAETQDDNAGTADVDETGQAVITWSGGGREGPGTVTLTHTSLPSASVSATFFGAAANLAAEALQGSVEAGGSIFVVLTVTDSEGSAVSGAAPVASTSTEDELAPIIKPEGTDTVGVMTDFTVAKAESEEGAGDGIPACDDDDGDPATGGTNDDGQCVVEVYASKEGNDRDGGADPSTTDPDTTTASRGVNTLNFELARTGDDPLRAAAAVTVAGAADSITSDAPASVDPLSTTTIALTVKDDTDVLVGATTVHVVKVAGEGIIGDGASARAMLTTDNGVASFDYTAGLGGDTAVFRVTAGDAGLTISITIGEPEDTGPIVVELTDGPASTYVSWNDDWGTVSSSTFENVAGLVVVWKWTGTMWIGYVSSPTAPAATKTSFTVAPGDVLYVVSNGAVTFTLY